MCVCTAKTEMPNSNIQNAKIENTKNPRLLSKESVTPVVVQSRICYGNTRESQCMHGPRHTSSTAAVSYFIHVSADKLNILVQAHRSPQTPDITTWYISSGNLAEHMYPTTPRPKVLWTESGGRSRPNKNLAEISR